jgi:cytochrome P450
MSKLFFFVFTDTSTVTLEWVMAELLQHPDIMKRAQAELDNIVGTNRLVEESDLQNLPYLQAILKENFRIHPPAPLMVPHCSIETSQVQGYNLPANTRVLVNLWAMGRDPSIWANPLQFDPNRFMQHHDIDVQGQNFELLPFGTGKRACPGRPLANLFVQIALARLLQSFDYSIPKEEQESIDMSATFGITLKKRNALCVVAHPKLQAHFYD